MDEGRFNKVFIGPGLIAELFLHALIRHKGESPEDFYILGNNEERCERLRKKYQIRATTNFNAFVSKAKVIVLAADVDDLDDIPDIVNSIRDNVPSHALINSVTSKLSIALIENYFPNHPVMRLSLSFSMINGNSIGTYICGSVDPEDTEPVARFLIESFGELIEVETEEEFEKVHDVIFAQNCSNYLAINSFINSAIKTGLTPQQARKIAATTYKGVGETFSEKYKDDTLRRMFDFKGVFNKGLEVMEDLGMADEIKNAHELQPETIQKNLQASAPTTYRSPVADKFKFRYKNWDSD